jgi:drug/metabolite transporter (DMT)-like permease
LPASVFVIWSSLCFIWGTTWIAIKIGLNDLPPIGFAALRFVLAIILLFAIVRVQKTPLPNTAKAWRFLAITGVLQFSGNYSLVFWGEQYIASGLAAVLQATMSIFGLALAWIFLPNEKITSAKIVAVCFGVIGVAVIFSDQLRVQNMMAFYGSVGMVVAAYAATQSAILVKARGQGLAPSTMLLGQMVCGLPPLIAYSLIVEGNPLHYHWTWQAVAALLHLASVGTIAAFWLYYWLLKRVESTFAMLISVVTPLIAVIVGWVVLDERLPPQTLLGGVLILASIVLTVFGRKGG